MEAHSLPAITVTDAPVERTAVSVVVIELAVSRMPEQASGYPNMYHHVTQMLSLFNLWY